MTRLLSDQHMHLSVSHLPYDLHKPYTVGYPVSCMSTERARRHLLCIQKRRNIISMTTTKANASLFNICILNHRLAKITALL